jgi:amino acid transporter
MGMVHGVHKTPYFAVYMSALITLIIIVPLAINQGFLNAFGLTGTIATYGFVIVYLGVCVVAPVDMYKGGVMKPQHIFFGVAGAVLMGFVIYASLVPYPAAPFNWLPPIFAIYLVIGLIWFLVLKSKNPQVLLSIANDMEG